MGQSLAQIYVHLVFSTKDRKPWLRDDGLRDQLYAYMAAILRDNVDSPALLINGVEDHVHSLIRLSRKFPVMIQNQREHHRQMFYQDEFRELCRRHGLALEERYAWD